MVGRIWRLSLRALILAKAADHICTCRGVAGQGLEFELNLLARLVMGFFDPATFAVVGLVLGIFLAALGAVAARVSLTVFFGPWVGVRAGIAFNLIGGALFLLSGMGVMHALLRSIIIEVRYCTWLSCPIAGALAAFLWLGVIVILICIDMEGLEDL